MRQRIHKILVTGGAGFIGSEFVRQSVSKGYPITVVDKLTYAGDLARLKEITGKYTFYKIDITNKKRLANVFKKEKPDAIVHFAAETHVDRSIRDARPFVQTNVVGTQNLIDSARANKIKRFIHISTDEVYGESFKGRFKETAALLPNNPYSATKASAEMLIRAAIRTYKLQAIIVRPANNYGPWQYPEKFIPVIILKALKNQPIPVYGEGEQIREWLHVSDCALGILKILQKGVIGSSYNIGSHFETNNLTTVKIILKLMNRPFSLIEFIKDRAGHDFRYSVDYFQLQKLGWTPKKTFPDGIRQAIQWNKDHINWLEKRLISTKNYSKKIYKK